MPHKILDHLRDAVFSLDHNWRFYYINQATEQLLGKSREELTGTCIWHLYQELVGSPFYYQFHQALEQNKEVRFEERFTSINKWYEIRAYPYETGIIVHFTDINAKKKVTEKEREHYKSLFEQNPDAVYSMDLNGKYTSVNRSFEILFGYHQEDCLQMDFTSLVNRDDSEKAFRHFLLASKGIPQEYENVCIHRLGKSIHVKVTNLPIIVNDEVVGIYGIIKDITQEKVIQQEIKESEANLKLALKVAKLGTWEWDIKENKRVWSDDSYEMFGSYFRSPQIKYEDFLALIHPNDKKLVADAIDDLKLGHPLNIHYRIVKPNGQLRHLEEVAEAIFDIEGNVMKLVGATRDITERRIEQDRLKKSEELYRLISENSQDFISFLSPVGVIQYISPAVENLLGFTPADLVGKSGADLIDEDDKTSISQMSIEDSDIFPVRVRHQKGHELWIEVSLKIIRDEKGDIEKILVIGRDISDRIEAKELLVKSEKLSLTGQLAAGIAHEIRNPLTAIKGFVQMMQLGYEIQEEYISLMSSELNRIEFILNELLLLAKPTESKFEQREIHTILNHVITLLETESNLKNVRINKQLYEEDLFIDCNENQLKQIFINFVKNALEAMPEGGTIDICTREEDGEVEVVIRDYGYGIEAEKLEKIGQPFYTTKENGTGLGLAVSFSIIEHHKGKIAIESEVNQGTTIIVKLPLAKNNNKEVTELIEDYTE
ncbi:PAS domain-containing sensor histidine kinase [Bacillus alkalicellulosilyticus]|uniref:PAS domain-containing sensor histidine kinase n=1 Tax=Alkalihalobacterium alkalicellulosilyticum TaxID=1912214 RepID=UPI0009976487|nr:PAS domain-containing sensor histidine kinase [Bacillus alkalicellulosilyticus]